MKSKGSRCFLPWAEGDFGVSLSRALCTAEMSELEIIKFIPLSAAAGTGGEQEWKLMGQKVTNHHRRSVTHLCV